MLSSCCRNDEERKKARQNQNNTTSQNNAAAAKPPKTFNRRKLLRQKNVPPVVPANGFSIVEQIFYKSPIERPQVILGGALRIEIPPAVRRFNVTRVIDLLKLLAASHPRLSSYVDPEKIESIPFGETADQIPIHYRVVESNGSGTLAPVFHEEINTNFLVNEPKPMLWRVVLIVPPGTPHDDVALPEVISGKSLVEEPTVEVKDDIDLDDWDKPPSAQALAAAANVIDDSIEKTKASTRRRSFFSNRSNTWKHTKKQSSAGRIQTEIAGSTDPENTFEIIFTFHHCIGDGLSLYTFVKSMFANFTADQFNAPSLNLNQVPIVTEPVPLLDNLVNPGVLEVLPAAFGMVFEMLGKKSRDRFKGRFRPGKSSSPPASKNNSPTPSSKPKPIENQSLLRPELSVPSYSSLPTTKSIDVIQESSSNPENHLLAPPSERTRTESYHSGNSAVVKNIPPVPFYDGDKLYGLRSVYSNTKIRFLTFDSEFVTMLRKRCKTEGTTIAGALVVAALAAVKTSFQADYTDKPLPTHQGWVVTNSARHLLPQSRLLDGGDKQSDPSIDVFGGYAGSVSSVLKLVDNQDFWERSRLVRRKIARAFLVSLQRMKLANYCYRRPKIYEMIEKHADLESRSRSYSIELANLGAWDYPYGCAASGGSNEHPNWMRLENFWGAVNSSFDGVRGLFTVGVVTLGGNMSVAIGYDSRAVHEADADLFVKSCTQILRKAAESETGSGKLKIGNLREITEEEKRKSMDNKEL